MGRAQTYAVCLVALLVGAVAGPLVRAKPTHRTIEAPTENVPPPATAPALATVPVALKPLAAPPTSESAGVKPASVQADPPEPRLSRAEVLVLAEHCVPTEPAKVLTSIVDVESDRRPLRIGVNGKQRAFMDPTTKPQAVELASRLIAAGRSIDLGLAQINSNNLQWLGLSVEQAFDPCRNLAAAGRVMSAGYKAALKVSRPDQSILQAAYSLYNTGTADRGMVNGYVARLEAQARRSTNTAP